MSDTLTTRIAAACRLADERTDAAGDQRTLAALAEAAQLADVAGVISPNDTLREVSTPSLRVLFLPSIQAEVEASARSPDGADRMAARKAHVQHALGAARLFLQAATQLGAIAPQLGAILKRQIEAPTTLVGAAERREQKIMLFKLGRELRGLLDAFRRDYRAAAQTRAGTSSASYVPHEALFDLLIVQSDDDDEDDEGGAAPLTPAPPKSLRQYLLLLLELHAVHTAGVLESAMQELELLQHAPAPSEAPPADPTWRLDSRFFSGPLLSESGKPLRPFTITSAHDRTQVKNEAFRPSHRLPTMTIDEYLAEEQRRGNIISGGGHAQAAEATPREARAELAENDGTAAAEEAEEEARREAIHWDAFTEANPRGTGNTMNRG